MLALCAGLPLQILGNGDEKQNSTGAIPNAYASREQFYERKLPYVFANIQHLTGSRRLKSAEDVVPAPLSESPRFWGVRALPRTLLRSSSCVTNNACSMRSVP